MPKVGSSTTPTRIVWPASKTRSCSSFSSVSSRRWRHRGQVRAGTPGDRRKGPRAGRNGAARRPAARRPTRGHGDRAAAEIKRPARAVENHLHAGRVFQLPPAADRRGQRGHRRARRPLQQLDGQVDRAAGDLRLVALDVDDDIDAGHPPGDLGHAIGAAGGRGAGHVDLAAEGPHRVEDLLVVGGHADARRPRGPPGRFVGVLDQRLARLAPAAASAAAGSRRAGRE